MSSDGTFHTQIVETVVKNIKEHIDFNNSLYYLDQLYLLDYLIN